MATAVALNLFVLAFIGGLITYGLVLAAGVEIWRTGTRGKFQGVTAALIIVAVFAGPFSYLSAYFELPRLNDISTDINTPPRFVAIARERSPRANPVTFDARRAANFQRAAYPDLRSITVPRSGANAFELVVDTLQRLHFKIISRQQPNLRTGRPGWVEAQDRTLIMGFYDDVVVRIIGDLRRSRIDIRSASRYGQHDFGQNATRIRRILNELQLRLEATVTTTLRDRLGKRRREIRARIRARRRELKRKKLKRRQ